MQLSLLLQAVLGVLCSISISSRVDSSIVFSVPIYLLSPHCFSKKGSLSFAWPDWEAPPLSLCPSTRSQALEVKSGCCYQLHQTAAPSNAVELRLKPLLRSCKFRSYPHHVAASMVPASSLAPGGFTPALSQSFGLSQRYPVQLVEGVESN
jgi:hypothetical protein